MNSSVRVLLDASPDQIARLMALQSAFAQTCNALAPLVQKTRCWNRVTLHHLAYKPMREQFPSMGSQMVCNAIYSVSRASRLVYQHPASPFHMSRFVGKPLPLLKFADSCPVYFDRHTLSVKDRQLSMYTLDGRMHFQLALREEDEQAFHSKKLREIVLTRNVGDVFELHFQFSDIAEEDVPVPAQTAGAALPDYVMVEEVQ